VRLPREAFYILCEVSRITAPWLLPGLFCGGNGIFTTYYIIMKITWRTVPGLGELKISSGGILRKKNDDGLYMYAPVQKSNNGYYYVSFKNKKYFIHRLLALAFIPNPEGKPYINHKNGNKRDNRVDNIEWCTQQENTYHSVYTLNNTTNFGKKPVNVFKDGALVFEAKTVRQAAAFVNGTHTRVIGVCRGLRNHHKGYIFKYA
jgi:hypothetical protein